jgi:hypothetical protein
MKPYGLRKIIICISIFTFALVSCSSPASPELVSQISQLLMAKLSIDELTTRADRIVVGEVTSIEYDREGNENIKTLVSLSGCVP